MAGCKNKPVTGLISNIQRFSLDDGPGIRTTVFLKGCNLRCPWCHNPETQYTGRSLQYNAASCIGCGTCAAVCPAGVHSFVTAAAAAEPDDTGHSGAEDNSRKVRHILHREDCLFCGSCAENCPTGSLKLIGDSYSAEDIFHIVKKDRSYYKTSGGGVTFSGGEPLLQAEFLKEALQLCKAEGLHTAMDTAGALLWEKFELVLPWTDLFLYDLKLWDEEKHRELIGVSNQPVFDNYRKLMKTGRPVWVRMPIIRGINDDPEGVRHLGQFMLEAGIPERIDLLPYHSYGLGKYESLGMQCAITDHTPPSPQLMEGLASLLKGMGLPAQAS